jgi:two-component system, response regulator PdtaR
MRLVIVEDDVMLADFIEEALTDLRYDVSGTANNVADALRLIRLHRPDGVLLDARLGPWETGTDVVDALAASDDLHGLGILYVTGGPDWVVQNARGGQACLAKPYSVEALHQSLEIVIRMAGDRNWVPHSVPRGLQLLQSARTLAQNHPPMIAAMRGEKQLAACG